MEFIALSFDVKSSEYKRKRKINYRIFIIVETIVLYVIHWYNYSSTFFSIKYKAEFILSLCENCFILFLQKY